MRGHFQIIEDSANVLEVPSQRSMSNRLIYVLDAHFIDKIEKNKISWTQVPVN
jgi:hypothetical protein